MAKQKAEPTPHGVSIVQRLDYADAAPVERVRSNLTQWLNSPEYDKACAARGAASTEELARRLQTALDGILAFGYPSDLLTIIACAVAYSAKVRPPEDAAKPRRV